MGNYYEGTTPLLISVDCIVFGFDEGKLKLLIGKRKMNPGKGEWSLYGGFVQMNESLEQAATRTLCSLTGLDNIYMTQVGAYGAVDRDPGERVISIAYCSLINVSDYNEAQQTEYGVEWVSVDELPDLYSDHKTMVTEAIEKLRRHLSTEPLCFNLLPEHFTLTQLQKVYEAILGEEIDKRNFRKRIKTMECIQKTKLVDKLSSKRGAALYRFSESRFQKEEKFKL
jgi:ADP-ribose pyrophosphatase YjhB (NUDIX family)